MNKDQLNNLLSTSEYKLIFRYKTGPSYITPSSRKYIFVIYKPKDSQKYCIYKEWRPSSWEGEPNLEYRKESDPDFYRKVLQWRNDFKIREIKQSEKVLLEIKEFPDPKSLKYETIYDGGMSDLEIDIDGFKAKYSWMMLVDEQQDFEKKIKKVIRMVKR